MLLEALTSVPAELLLSSLCVASVTAFNRSVVFAVVRSNTVPTNCLQWTHTSLRGLHVETDRRGCRENFSLWKTAVFPAASSLTIKIVISVLPSNRSHGLVVVSTRT